MDYFQIIPLLTLTAYFFYLTYYYAAPMFRLKVMLFYTHIKYRGVKIFFRDEKILMIIAEKSFERPIEMDPTSRYFAASVCYEFRKLLKDVRRGFILESEEQYGLSTGQRTRGAGRQRTEKDRD